jgi:hypothetical protein
MCENENQIEVQKFYRLKLNEPIEIKTNGVNYFVTRVIGGWIYNHIGLNQKQMNAVFVPFNNEFN